jgi:rare lipoprotein A
VLRAASAVGLAGACGAAITLGAGLPASLSSSTAMAAEPPGAPVQATVADRSLGYGQSVVVRGRLASGQAGAPVSLEYRPAGSPVWQAIGGGTTSEGGTFRLTAALQRSGTVRVVEPGAAARGAAVGEPVTAASPERSVRVAAAIATGPVRRHLGAGRTWKVGGTVRPGGAGRVVSLQLRRDGRWRTVDHDRTSVSGRFRLAEELRTAMSAPARVRFPGDAANATSQRSLGRVNAYRMAFASAYGPGLYGNRMACGGTLTTATIGVAHKTLPCGTRLTLRHGNHTVRARVIDRGPFVAGREFDLTWATKNRLGLHSMAWIRVTR